MRVAVIDDQDDIASLIAVQLSYVEGAEVVATLRDYEEVVAFTGWGQVDAATVDWMLPGRRDGLAVIGWLQAHHPHVRTVIITAAPEALADQHPGWTGGVLAKPYDVRDLVAALGGEEHG